MTPRWPYDDPDGERKRRRRPPPARIPGGFAGKLLRVDMTKGKCWAEPWSAEQMREQTRRHRPRRHDPLQGDARRGKKNVTWDHPDNRLVLATGPLAGLPVWGTGGLTVITHRRRHQRPDVHAGQRLLRHQPQVLRLRRDRRAGPVADVEVPLHQRRRRSSCATPGTSSARTRGRRRTRSTRSSASRAISSPCTPSGPRARTSCASRPSRATTATSRPRTACGAVMGKKKLKAVAIVQGHEGAARGRLRAASCRPPTTSRTI